MYICTHTGAGTSWATGAGPWHGSWELDQAELEPSQTHQRAGPRLCTKGAGSQELELTRSWELGTKLRKTQELKTNQSQSQS